MQEVMADYRRKVWDAMHGDITAQVYLIDCQRGDSTYSTPKRWTSFRDWARWNNEHGNSIRRMLKEAEEDMRKEQSHG